LQCRSHVGFRTQMVHPLHQLVPGDVVIQVLFDGACLVIGSCTEWLSALPKGRFYSQPVQQAATWEALDDEGGLLAGQRF
jgi:hypothetical protein